MVDINGKPRFVDKWGNISNIVSAASALTFGIASVVIAWNVWLLQSQAADEASKARDNDNLARFADTLSKEGARFDKSYRCHSAFFWYIDNNKAETLDLEKDRDSLFKIFSQPIGNELDEKNRQECTKDGQIPFLSGFFFSLNILEMALSNWKSQMPRDRKESYYKQLFVVTCTGYTKNREIFDVYDRKINNIFVKGFANIPSFIKDCKEAETYLKAQAALRLKG